MTPKNQQELEKLLKKRDAKTRMSAKAFKDRALTVIARCLELRKEAVKAALEPGITDAEKADAWDKAESYVSMALEWAQTAMLPSDLREAQEAKGSEKGIKQRRNDEEFTKGDFLDELDQIHDPNKTAEWHRQQLYKNRLKPPGVRQIQRDLKIIRSRQK